jgi:hypothetical protein
MTSHDLARHFDLIFWKALKRLNTQEEEEVPACGHESVVTMSKERSAWDSFLRQPGPI